jgi:methionine-R-sulfoxide reductase
MQPRRFLPLLPARALACALGISAASFFAPLATAAEKPASGGDKGTETSSNNSVNKDELRKKLSPLQYDVTCNAATEPPFRNAYWDNHAVGLYVDVIDGEPLFASNHKFDSGSGWPSFFQPVTKGSIIEKEDRSHNMIRVEVISKKSGAHLGHLFPDGPRPTGMRYCINSASLRFIPIADLEKEGYGKLRPLFEETADASKKPAAAGPASEPAKK